jgi:hypothetical protein
LSLIKRQGTNRRRGLMVHSQSSTLGRSRFLDSTRGRFGGF